MDQPRLKQIAIEFLQAAATGDVRDAYEKHIAPSFRHHNPYFREDAAALQSGMEANTKQFPKKSFEVQRALEDGQLVAVHSKIAMQPGDRGIAVVHIFRFEGAKIAEMWDIGQPVPELSENALGMF